MDNAKESRVAGEIRDALLEQMAAGEVTIEETGDSESSPTVRFRWEGDWGCGVRKVQASLPKDALRDSVKSEWIQSIFEEWVLALHKDWEDSQC